MFEEYTFENILNSMLGKVPAGIDKREGSIIYDALAPAAAELCQYYISLDGVMKETFADTASREYLVLRCAERGITPFEATAAEFKAYFDKEIEAGERFTAGDVNFYAAEKLEGEFYCRLVCEEAGTAGNVALGEIFPLKTINGLTEARLTEMIVPGRDEEETENLRKRYFDSFVNIAFGGNRADYITRIKALDGVSDVKVVRAAYGAGTVKAVLLGADFCVPTEAVISAVQEAVDPESGEGVGFAPIDHIVTIVAAEGTKVDISTDITFDEGFSFEELKNVMEDVIDGYFKELAAKWSDNENLVVRISHIESRLLEIEGIVDIANTTLNGEASNLTIGEYAIPVRGDINDTSL